MTNSKAPLNLAEQRIGGKTLGDWDREWSRLEGGFRVVHTALNHKVGLYRAVLNGEIVAIGKGAEPKNGGLRKRLSDFRRKCGSNRDHKTGWFIHENLEQIEAEVLITGEGEKGKELANSLKGPMIKLLKPTQNVPDAIVKERIIAVSKSRKT